MHISLSKFKRTVCDWCCEKLPVDVLKEVVEGSLLEWCSEDCRNIFLEEMNRIKENPTCMCSGRDNDPDKCCDGRDAKHRPAVCVVTSINQYHNNELESFSMLVCEFHKKSRYENKAHPFFEEKHFFNEIDGFPIHKLVGWSY